MAPLPKVVTPEWLIKNGYVETKPGRYEKKTKEKAKPDHLKHIKSPTLVIGGKTYKFRSGWEAVYALYLQYLKETNQIKDWEYEIKRFIFDKIRRGTTSYLPDFKVIALDGSHTWHEIKGWLDKKSRTKLKRMRIYYPNEVVVVVGRKEINDIKKSGIVKYE